MDTSADRSPAFSASPSSGDRQLRPWLRLRWLAALLGAAWLVPFGLHELRLDVLVPLLLLIAVASVLRSGTNLVDRLVLAACLLSGVALSLGLVFSVWPWRLAPVPVGGALFSLVVLTGWFTRRCPRLPRRLLGSDLVVAGSGVFAFWAAHAPIAGLSPVQGLTFSTISTDRFNHFSLFDTIHRLGGYAFLHQRQARSSVEPPSQVSYPSGSHFLFALFDTFLRSATNPGAPLPEFNRYFVYVLAAYAFLVTALVWAARWIAGPRMAGWRRFAICAAVAALAIGGPLVKLVEFGLDSDIVGLAFVALAVAVAMRPPHVVQEQVLIAGALLIAVAYSYSLFAPMAVLCMGISAMVYHRRLGRHWRFTAVTAVVCSAVAGYPSALSLASGFDAKAQTLATVGWFVPLPGPLVAGLAVVIVATMASPVSRRLPVCRAMAAELLVSATVIGAFAVYQLREIGHTGYYFNKLMLAGYVVCLAGLGVLGSFLRPVHARARADRRRSRLAEGGLAVAIGAVAMSLVTLVQSGVSNGHPAIWVGSALADWNTDKVQASASPSLIALADARLLGDGVPTVVFAGNTRTDQYGYYFAAVLNHDRGAMSGLFETIRTTFMAGSLAHWDAGSQELLAAQRVLERDAPVRFVVCRPVLAARIRAMLADRPHPGATVLVLRTLCRAQP